MRVFSTQFGLAVASLALVCIVADSAEGGPFRRRNNCCNAYSGYSSGYGSGYGNVMNASPNMGYQASACCGSPMVGRSQIYSGTAGTAYYAPGGYMNGTQVYYPAYGYPNSTQAYYQPNGSTYYLPNGNGTQPYYSNGVTQAGYNIPPTSVPNILPARATEVRVRVTDNAFEPATLTIAPGTTVRWTNEGKNLHTVTATKGDWSSNDLNPGQEFTATFTQPGTFDYYCRDQKDKEMKGTIIVR